MTAVQRVLVVGSDSHAWLAAAALKRAFHRRGLDVCVLDLGATGDAPVARWTLPSLLGMLSLLGIKETDFVRRTDATFKLATEHRGWQSATSRFLHAHGELGIELAGVPFYRYLLQQAVRRSKERHELYSLAAMAARSGRFARPMSHSRLTSSFTYALHVPEASCAAYLREHAERLGVRRIEGRLEHVALAPSGDIDELILANAGRAKADFYVDCSGRAGRLIGRVCDAPRDDWSAWLPNDRMLSAAAAPIDDARAVTETIAQETGWLWRLPLARSSAVGFVYNSAFLSDEAAIERLVSFGAVRSEDVSRTVLSQGRRQRFWERNCVALGEAALEIEPLAGASLHFTQLGIATFIEMFPIARDTRLETIEYNRTVGEYADSLRDFTIAHYMTSARSDAYWAAARAAAPPLRLQHKMDLYAATGRIELLDNEVFDETDWAWLLLGSGAFPDRIGLHSQSTLSNLRSGDLVGLRESIERLAATMPRHMDFVRQHG
ncbi:MAG: tryptophan 7-halogenase [Xanthomonadaceae bacterium]|nr:tryptophan 7-halogenase [Xanthomonadaceae bacterium]